MHVSESDHAPNGPSRSGPMRCQRLHSWRTYGERARLDGRVNRLQICRICGALRTLAPGQDEGDRRN